MEYENIIIDGVLCKMTVADGIITAIQPIGNLRDEHGTARADGLRLALPGLANMHTHSAMTLLRSAGSGLPLHRWLHEAIFPIEAQLTPDDIYHGARQACLEMLQSGTTAFNDMYFSIESTLRAAQETGLGGNIALSVTDPDFENGTVERFVKEYDRNAGMTTSSPTSTATPLTHTTNPQLTISLAPHAIYTVSGKHLQYAADFAHDHGTLFHIHLSETQKEREDCLREHGVPPVVYLEQLHIFDRVGSRFIGAHALWLDADEISILGGHGASVVHCPCSNLKLGSGHRFLYSELRDAGVNVTLGTDGSASSDGLNLIEAAKFMALLQKGWRCDPSVLPADELFQVASANGRRALGLPDNTLRQGNVADFFLVNLSRPAFYGVDFSLPPAKLHHDLLNRLFFAGAYF
ncbi:MAG: amidohydrolase [Bacteroidales bacterium]|nr:amidohydrolase [Bacteroidales bacterium]